MTAPLLRVSGLAVRYRSRSGDVDALHSAGIEIAPGQTVAVVGESGSGKSTLAHAVLGLLPDAARIVAGRIDFDGMDLTRLHERAFTTLRGREIALVPQDPGTGLNPVQRIGDQVAEVLRLHDLAGARDAAVRTVGLLEEAGVPEPALRARQYPHELSGGLRQRALIAMALAGRPRLVVADEPTSALDVTVQQHVLDRLETLTRASGTAVLLITHDLAVAADRADHIVVLSGGRVVEAHDRGEVLCAPARRTVPRRPPARSDGDVHVRAEALVKEYPLPRGYEGDQVLRAVDDVTFELRRGETFGLVGESGSGKSTIARILLGLTPPTSGRVLVDGRDVAALSSRDRRQLRRTVQVVHQNPYASLNPRMDVARIVQEPLASFGIGTRAERRARAAELLDLVRLPAVLARRRPHELSGGQRQRVAIARALALRPLLLVCDEPVSALDASVQTQLVDLLVDLQAQLDVTYLFITHDLALVRDLAHRVGVLERGRLVEQGPVDRLFADPGHAYTRRLLAAVPGSRTPSAPTLPT
nr:ABC transporter ATP-binding protein [Jiangella endophytica]